MQARGIIRRHLGRALGKMHTKRVKVLLDAALVKKVVSAEVRVIGTPIRIFY